MRFLVGCSILLLTAVGSASATEWYVDNSGGSDLHDGRSADIALAGSGPFRTIARAMRSAGKGDSVILRNTGLPYREQVSIQGGRHSGRPDYPFRFVGNGAVIDGRAPVPATEWEHYREDIFRFAPTRLSSQILFRDGLPLIERRPRDDGFFPDLAPLEWSLIGGKVYFRTEPGLLPMQYDLSFAALQTGITVYDVSSVEILDVVVQGFALDGLNAHANCFDLRISNVVARGNGRAGISIGGASRALLTDSLVGDNRLAQVRAEGLARLTISNSELLENTAPPIVEAGGTILVETAARR